MRFKNTCMVLILIALSLCLRAIPWNKVVQAESCPTAHYAGSNGPHQGDSYIFYLQGTDNVVDNGVRDSFIIWNQHNQTSNCSNVSFTESIGTPPSQATQGPYDYLLYTANPIPNAISPNAAMQTDMFWYPHNCTNGAVGIQKPITWIKYPSNAQLSNQGNYFISFPIALRKFMAHEIGHVMGLHDQADPIVQYWSIMNTGLGTNDCGSTNPPTSSGGNLPYNPAEPKICDHQGIQCLPCPTPTPTPAPPYCQTIHYQTPVWNECCLWYLHEYERWCDGVFVSYWYSWEFISCSYCE